MDMIVLGTTTWVWSAVTLAWVVVAVTAIIIAHHYTTRKKGLVPPGPRGLPIIGHLHLLGKNPHQDLQKLSQTHGPIMRLRLGSVDTVVASSPQAAELFLKTHDLNFATRPPMRIADFLTYDKKGAVLGRYGPVWREMRKLYVIELLTNHKMGSFESLRREELCLLVESLKQAAAADLSAKVACMNMNISCRMLFGKKYEDKDIGDEKGFKVVIDQAIHLISATDLGDYFPLLSKLDVQGLSRRARVVMNLFDQFFERILVEHENKPSPTSTTTEDFVDIILAMVRNKRTSFPFTRDHIKSMMLDVLVASMDTASTVVVWAMSELIKNPTKMKRLKEELERQVGLHRMVEEKDLEHLKYLELVIKETLRLHPTAPLLIPRAAIEDCTVSDFHVPKNAMLMINVWAIGRDPNVWSDPEKFVPERFEGSNVDYRGRHFELLPFGSGRRSCPGLELGITMVRLMVAQLAHCFDWRLPNATVPQDLDMTDKYGLVMNRVHNLVVVPTYRLLV
ncbi:unnamed protein product [Cuscuta campestris]|uniref:Cytochrome P450 n=1 Tax=Cuscuta campestris TaxID=132261 RepID=A0A484L1I5_9ASTE|nr:unnamed protein product [Cuscuta campestris]